jgi:pimeloyl-ACP methyl ester carboxylesterase
MASNRSMPALEGVEHRFVDVGDVRLHVATAGTGPPLVLLHGWPQHWWCWRHLIPELARHHRVLAPDLRGFGWSDAPAGDYAKSTFAADIVALLDREGIDRAPIIGHDWGGYTAFLLALDFPERVERVLALDIVPPWPQPGLPAPRHAALPLLASYQMLLATPFLGERLLTRGPEFVRTMIRAGSSGTWMTEALDVYADVLREPARAAASAACYRTFLTRELPATLVRGPRTLAVPALLAMGAHSPIRRVLRPKPAPNLRVETIPSARHFLPEERPAAVLALAREWLGGAGAAVTGAAGSRGATRGAGAA